MSFTRILADYAVRLRYEDLPKEVVCSLCSRFRDNKIVLEKEVE